MSRRLVPATLAATALLAALPARGVAPPDLPRPGCARRVADGDGDAKATFAPNVEERTSNPALDITGVVLRVTDTRVEAYLAILDLVEPAKMSAQDTAYLYEVTAQVGGKTLTFQAMQRNRAAAGSAADPQAYVPGPDETAYPKASHGGTALAGVTGPVADEAGYVLFAVPRANLEKSLGAPLRDGDTFTKIHAATTRYTAQYAIPVDETDVPDEQATYEVGDDYCFGPPPAQLTDLVTTTVQYGDDTTLGASLYTEDGDPLVDGLVRFEIGAGPAATAHDRADGDGVVAAPYRALLVPRTYDVLGVFDGDATRGAAAVAGTLVISPEVTAFAGAPRVSRPSAKARTVTVRLIDDDRHAVAGQRVDWYAGGRKVATTTTDRNGVATYTGARPGQRIQARFTGGGGRYVPATSATVTA